MDKEFIEKRAKIIVGLKDCCCNLGKELLEQVRKAIESDSLDSDCCTSFVKHADVTNGGCSDCRDVLKNANIATRKAMGY